MTRVRNLILASVAIRPIFEEIASLSEGNRQKVFAAAARNLKSRTRREDMVNRIAAAFLADEEQEETDTEEVETNETDGELTGLVDGLIQEVDQVQKDGKVDPNEALSILDGMMKMVTLLVESKPPPRPRKKKAKEFGTKEELDEYLQKHPDADKSLHTITKDKAQPAPKQKVQQPAPKQKVQQPAPVPAPTQTQEQVQEKPAPEQKPVKTEDGVQVKEDVPETFRSDLKGYKLQLVAGKDGVLDKADVENAKDIKEKLAWLNERMTKGIEKAADICQMKPPVCEGNMGITRDHMPQIMDKSVKELLASDNEKDRRKGQAAVDAGADPNDDRSVMQKLMEDVQAEGVAIDKGKVTVGQLKATQSEILADKTYGIANAMLEGNEKLAQVMQQPIIISSDNHILDGHHRYSAMLTADPGYEMNVIRLGMPMKDFLMRSHQQPGVFRADIKDNIIPDSNPVDLGGGPQTIERKKPGGGSTENTEEDNQDIEEENEDAFMDETLSQQSFSVVDSLDAMGAGLSDNQDGTGSGEWSTSDGRDAAQVDFAETDKGATVNLEFSDGSKTELNFDSSDTVREVYNQVQELIDGGTANPSDKVWGKEEWANYKKKYPDTEIKPKFASAMAERVAASFLASKGNQSQRKDKDLMSDTGGKSKGRDREPDGKPPRDDVKGRHRTKRKTKNEKDPDTDRDPDMKKSHLMERFYLRMAKLTDEEKQQVVEKVKEKLQGKNTENQGMGPTVMSQPNKPEDLVKEPETDPNMETGIEPAAPVEEMPAEAPVEGAPAPAEGAPVEEVPTEEAPTEEAPAEESGGFVPWDATTEFSNEFPIGTGDEEAIEEVDGEQSTEEEAEPKGTEEPAKADEPEGNPEEMDDSLDGVVNDMSTELQEISSDGNVSVSEVTGLLDNMVQMVTLLINSKGREASANKVARHHAMVERVAYDFIEDFKKRLKK